MNFYVTIFLILAVVWKKGKKETCRWGCHMYQAVTRPGCPKAVIMSHLPTHLPLPDHLCGFLDFGSENAATFMHSPRVDAMFLTSLAPRERLESMDN
jgi:hypothetical protein